MGLGGIVPRAGYKHPLELSRSWSVPCSVLGNNVIQSVPKFLRRTAKCCHDTESISLCCRRDRLPCHRAAQEAVGRPGCSWGFFWAGKKGEETNGMTKWRHVFLVLRFWFRAFPWHGAAGGGGGKHTCTRKMLRLFTFCSWPGARGNGSMTLALLGHYL